jgi:hypothetical protein
MNMDPLGITIIAIQTAAFLLLLIGVYPTKQREESKNLIKHGFFSTLALAVNLGTVFAFMLPIFIKIVSNTPNNGFVQYPALWAHALLGVVTLSSSIIMVASWALEPLSDLGCAKRWRLMKPTLAIWALSIVIGALMQILM